MGKTENDVGDAGTDEMPRAPCLGLLDAVLQPRNRRERRALARGRELERVKVRILPDGRLDRKNAALYLGHEVKTLAMWKVQGKGPKWVKVGGKVFYHQDDLDEFVQGET